MSLKKTCAMLYGLDAIAKQYGQPDWDVALLDIAASYEWWLSQEIWIDSLVLNFWFQDSVRESSKRSGYIL